MAIEQSHEAEIHVLLHMAMEEAEARLIGGEVDAHLLKAADHRHVLDHAGRRMPGDIQVTVTLKQVSCGTEVSIVQEGIPDLIPTEACYLGWQDSLRNLARLVEPEINR